MKFENRFCRLELAKKLEKLGVKQDSLFWWKQDKYSTNPNYGEAGWNNPQESMPWTIEFGSQPSKLSGNRVLFEYSAFTSAELGELLPYHLKNYGFLSFLKLDDKNYATEYSKSTAFVSESEADCRAQMLIWLIESGKVKI